MPKSFLSFKADQRSGAPNRANEENIQSHSDRTTAWLSLIRDRRWSSRQKRSLLTYVTDPRELYACSITELKQLLPKTWQAEHSQVSARDIARDLAWLEVDRHHLLCWGDSAYPPLLQQLPDPPIALFAIGKMELLLNPAVAIVGSRTPTPAGRNIAEKLAGGLSSLGISIVSGLALGIDGAAHQGALQAEGETIAVMGGGLHRVYPQRHQGLHEQVCQQGCVISEYPLGTPVSKYTFPQRNRLVSGLSLGVIIIEAAENSGTLITARLGTEQNRSVMVVPGSPLSPKYQGSNRLLQQGAALVTSVDDVLHELQLPLQSALDSQSKPSCPVPDQPHHRLLEYIFSESTSVDHIVTKSGLTAAEVSSMLLMLEVENAIVQADDGGYVKLVNL